MKKIPETRPILEGASRSAPRRSASKSPFFGTLTAKQGVEIISYLRFPDEPLRRQELVSPKSLRLSPNELFLLIRADQLLATLDRLERMGNHYLDVSKLEASEVRRRLDASDPD